jgi:hypothetical protein
VYVLLVALTGSTILALVGGIIVLLIGMPKPPSLH